MSLNLREMAVEVLSTADAHAKVAISREHAARWRAARAAGDDIALGTAAPPDAPARPARPELLSPRDVPHRKPGTPEGRVAMLHAIAHIELNAVDLHWDIIARFPDTDFPMGFYDDWVKAADEESKHFALPAHAGMWQAASDTAADIMGRLAVVPMVLEARGLDVTPGMIALFKQAKDKETVAARRGGRACGLWVQMVPLPVRATKP